MLSAIWLGFIVLSIILGMINGRLDQVVASVTDAADMSVKIAIGLVGIMAFWLGLMNIAEQSGLVRVLSRVIKPLMVRLFPKVPADHPAMGAMLLNIAANMLGLGNAATPFGLKAMEYLEDLNSNPGVATDAQCMFLVINTSSVQLIPATAIAYLAAAGANHPTDIILTTLLATLCSTVIGITAAKLFARFSHESD